MHVFMHMEAYVHACVHVCMCACVLLPVCYIGQQASRGSVQLGKKGVVISLLKQFPPKRQLCLLLCSHMYSDIMLRKCS